MWSAEYRITRAGLAAGFVDLGVQLSDGIRLVEVGSFRFEVCLVLDWEVEMVVWLDGG